MSEHRLFAIKRPLETASRDAVEQSIALPATEVRLLRPDHATMVEANVIASAFRQSKDTDRAQT